MVISCELCEYSTSLIAGRHSKKNVCEKTSKGAGHSTQEIRLRLGEVSCKVSISSLLWQ